MLSPRTSSVMLVLVLVSGAALGSVEPTLLVEEEFLGTSDGGVLRLRITASRNLPTAELTLEPLTAFVQPIQASYRLSLPAYVPVLVDAPLRRQGGDPWGILRVAIEASQGGVVRLLYFAPGERGTIRMISKSEFATLTEIKLRVEAEEAAERRAAPSTCLRVRWAARNH